MRFSADMREFVVDDSIAFAAVRYRHAVHSQAELERVFWDAAEKRVKQVCDRRHDIVRGKKYRRTDLADLDSLSSDTTPEDRALFRADVTASLHFTALLNPQEREIFECQQRAPGDKEFGDKRVAQELEMPLGVVRNVSRAIGQKHERFKAIYAAGRLCGYLAPSVSDLAANPALAEQAQAEGGGRLLAARVHLEIERCSRCRAEYARQWRYIHGTGVAGKAPALLPIPLEVERLRSGGRFRDWLPDWCARIFSQEPAGTATHLAASGAGRGLGVSAAAYLATFCLGGAGTLGACIATGVFPLPERDPTPAVVATATPTATPKPVDPEPTLPHGVVTPTPTPTPTKRARTTTSTRKKQATTQGGTRPRSHESEPASAAPSNAAPNGASEFDPGYQPSAPAPPAPAPAAPGASEFN